MWLPYFTCIRLKNANSYTNKYKSASPGPAWKTDNLKEDLTSKSGMGMLQAEHEEFNDFVFREIKVAILLATIFVVRRQRPLVPLCMWRRPPFIKLRPSAEHRHLNPQLCHASLSTPTIEEIVNEV
mmetsp:Transcript_99876/g.285543  ORF Transcript_99876/g.285543 Transcript_99876/m.285543 type:complete len:126 (+) Transcript_99876:961-1338(+)